MSLNGNLQSILDTNNFIGSYFLDWLRNLRIVLRAKKIASVFDRLLPQSSPTNASYSDQSAYQKHVANNEMVSCIMLASMITELQT